MALYIDDYGTVDTTYIISATLVDPPDASPSSSNRWLILMVLNVGDEPVNMAFSYPSRVLRDGAFENLCELLRKAALNARV